MPTSTGDDSFTYRLNDGALDSNLTTVTISVASVNDAPHGASTTVTSLEDTAYVFQLADFGFADENDAMTSITGGGDTKMHHLSVSSALLYDSAWTQKTPPTGCSGLPSKSGFFARAMRRRLDCPGDSSAN